MVALETLSNSRLKPCILSMKKSLKLSTSWANESCVGNTGDLGVKKLSIILKSCLVFEFSIFCL